MSAADHETAIRQAIQRLPNHLTDERDAHAALDALVGLLRQTERERDEWRQKAKTRADHYGEQFRRAERAEQEVERLKRGNQERWDCGCPFEGPHNENCAFGNQERETANAVEAEASNCRCGLVFTGSILGCARDNCPQVKP